MSTDSEDIAEDDYESQDRIIREVCPCMMHRDTWKEDLARATQHVQVALKTAAVAEGLCPRGSRELVTQILMWCGPRMGRPDWLRKVADDIDLIQRGGSPPSRERMN